MNRRRAVEWDSSSLLLTKALCQYFRPMKKKSWMRLSKEDSPPLDVWWQRTALGPGLFIQPVLAVLLVFLHDLRTFSSSSEAEAAVGDEDRHVSQFTIRRFPTGGRKCSLQARQII